MRPRQIGRPAMIFPLLPFPRVRTPLAPAFESRAPSPSASPARPPRPHGHGTHQRQADRTCWHRSMAGLPFKRGPGNTGIPQIRQGHHPDPMRRPASLPRLSAGDPAMSPWRRPLSVCRGAGVPILRGGLGRLAGRAACRCRRELVQPRRRRQIMNPELMPVARSWPSASEGRPVRSELQNDGTGEAARPPGPFAVLAGSFVPRHHCRAAPVSRSRGRGTWVLQARGRPPVNPIRGMPPQAWRGGIDGIGEKRDWESRLPRFRHRRPP